MERILVIYEKPNGKCPFSDWLNGLKDVKARAVVRARLNRIQLGNLAIARVSARESSSYESLLVQDIEFISDKTVSKS